MTIFSSLAAIALISAQSDTPQLEAGTPDEVRPRLEAALNTLEADGFSGFVAVTHHGEIVFEGSYGAANPETGAAFTRDTRIDMGSIVKSFTGMMAAALIDEGVLSPDMTLGQVFDDVPDDKANITLQQLLTHSAGFPGAVASDEEPLDRSELLRRAFDAPLRYEPGTSYQYSNTGFSLVAAIIETVTGRRYEDVLIDDFLLPAGITHTGYERSYDMANPPADMEFTQDGQMLHDVSWGGHAPGWALIGNGGMFTTVGDLIAWRQALNSGTLLPAEALRRAQTGYVREGADAPSYYGYGVVVEDSPLFGQIYWHNGGNNFLSAYWGEYADTGYAVFAATNQLEIDADRAALAATAAIFDAQLRMQSNEPDDWPEPDLNSTPAGQLASDYLRALSSDEAGRQLFVETRMSDALQAVATMDGHLAMFQDIAETVDGRSPAGMRLNDDVIALRFEGVPTVVLEIGFETDGERVLMSGLGITD